MNQEALYFAVTTSPIGELELVSDGQAIVGVDFRDHRQPRHVSRRTGEGTECLRRACEQLTAYFAGMLRQFDLPISLRGTPFQLRVWERLRAIPFGDTASYGEVARRLGHATAGRAVGAANARNPIAIIVPCHRVIGGDGRLTGYAGGVERKRWLLDHEAQVAGSTSAQRRGRERVGARLVHGSVR